jgi:hypothetical protein
MKLQQITPFLQRSVPTVQRSGNNEKERLERDLENKKTEITKYRKLRDEAGWWDSDKGHYHELVKKYENEYSHIAQSLARSDGTYEAIRTMQNLDWFEEEALPQQLEDIALNGEEERAFIREEMQEADSVHNSRMIDLGARLYQRTQRYEEQSKAMNKASRKLAPVLAKKNKLIQQKFAIYDKKAQQLEKAYKFPLREVRLKAGAVAGAISFGVGSLFGGAGVADKAIQHIEQTVKPIVPQLIHTLKK